MGIAVIVLLSGGSGVYWSWTPLPNLSLSITRDSINEGVFIFCRVIGGMSALLFIALTTPMTDLFTVMRQVRIPEVVVDLAMIIYRSIFSIMDQLVQTYQAQVMRLGYSSFRESVHSFGTLCGSVFIGSWNAGEDYIRAMDARCYDGKFATIGETRPVEPAPLVTVTAFLMISSAVVFITRDSTLLQAIA
jgi:cobalt/nickel transport system permease protein